MTTAERRVLLAVATVLMEGMAMIIDRVPRWAIAAHERDRIAERLKELGESLAHMDDPNPPRVA